MGNILSFARDSLTNLVSRMGTERDKASAGYYGLPILDDAQLSNSYRGAWLPRKIVDIPALDSVRAWRNWQAEGDQIEEIEAEEKRLNLQSKVLEARIKARLWGGAAIIIGTGDANPAEPLDMERVGKGGLKYLTVLSRRMLAAGEIDLDPTSEWFGRPKSFTLSGANGTQIVLHASRLVALYGAVQADDGSLSNMAAGWADSVLLAVMDAIKNADGTASNIASLVFEAKIDVFGIPDFMANVGSAEYRNKVIERYTLAATNKGINGALIRDKEEEYDQKQVNFATLPDVLDRFLQIVSGAADIPATRLLGQAPAGMNSTGESDLRNYYDRISAMQSLEMTPALARLDECLIRSALGSRDPSIYYTWAPLWTLSDKDRADIFKTKADAARAIAGTGGMSPALMPIDALSDALVNELVEDGSLSGLEAAIEEYGKLSEQEEDPAETEAALLPAPTNQTVPPKKKVAANDAALNAVDIIKGAMDGGATFDEAIALADQTSFAVRMAQRLGADTLVDLMQQAATDAAPRTLYVSRKVTNAAAIVAWAKAQGFETTLPAADMHVTIAFSRTPVDWFAVGESWSPELKISAGGARQMEQFGDATVLLFTASDLRWRHDEIERAGASWDHPEYQPHITISYGFKGDLSKVEPYQGPIVLGPELFAEVKEDWKGGVTEL